MSNERACFSCGYYDSGVCFVIECDDCAEFGDCEACLYFTSCHGKRRELSNADALPQQSQDNDVLIF